MTWFLRRVMGMWVILAVMCVGVVLIARQNRRLPDGLQQLGFRECGSALCFGNIALGMTWEEAQAQPDVFWPGGEEPRVESASLGLVRLDLMRSGGEKPIIADFWVHTSAPRLPITLAEIMPYLGQPCKISFLDYRSQYGGIAVQFDGGEALVPLFQQTANAPINPRVEFQLKPDTPINQFWLYAQRVRQGCKCEEDGLAGAEFCAAWQGFTNTQVLIARKARENRPMP